jgi:hypothetical protein
MIANNVFHGEHLYYDFWNNAFYIIKDLVSDNKKEESYIVD